MRNVNWLLCMVWLTLTSCNSLVGMDEWTIEKRDSGDSETGNGGDSTSETSTDTRTDSDSDSVKDSNGGDGDSDTDTDTDSDTDTDTDTDTDSDTDTNSDTDTVRDSESQTVDTGRDTETATNADSDTGVDTGTDLIPETESDMCDPNPCLNGSCVEFSNGYSCNCNDGWDGINCDMCASGFAGDQCDRCDIGFAGIDCHTRVCVVLADRDSTAGSPDGSTWENAFPDVSRAIEKAAQRVSDGADQCEVWVAEGTYTPADGIPSSGQSSELSISLLPKVRLYGGFTGVETMRSERDFRNNTTILSCDLSGDDDIVFSNTGDNCRHVLTVVESGYLDGFTITGGYNPGTGSDPVSVESGNGGGVYNAAGTLEVANCVFSYNYAMRGGAIFSRSVDENDNYLSIANTVFEFNHATSHGGAMFSEWVATVMFNSIVRENEAEVNGGAVHTEYEPASFQSSILYGNTAGEYGGALSNYYTSSTIYLSILWANSAGTDGDDIFNQTGGTSARYSILPGGYDNLIDVIEDDPLFVDAAGGDFSVQTGSPVIDGGNNDYVLMLDWPDLDDDGVTVEEISVDIEGNPRITDGDLDNKPVIDLGPYEYLPQ